MATKPADGGASRYRIVRGVGKARVENHEGATTEGSEAAPAPESAETPDAR